MKKNEMNELVEKALREHPVTRDDDLKLFVWVVYYIKPELMDKKFSETLWNHKENGLPSFETVTRIRRKLQEKNYHLRGKAYEDRHHKESEYIMRFGKNYNDGKEVTA